MSTIDLNITIKAGTRAEYQSWKLVVSATDAETPEAGVPSNDIFVFAVTKWSTGEQHRFSHVATLHDMQNLPRSRSDIPPKSTGYFRSSILELEFHNRPAVDRAIELITKGARLLMYAMTNQAPLVEKTVTVGPESTSG